MLDEVRGRVELSVRVARDRRRTARRGPSSGGEYMRAATRGAARARERDRAAVHEPLAQLADRSTTQPEPARRRS